MDIQYILAGIAIIVIAIWFAMRQAKKRGQAEAQAKASRKAVDHAKQARKTREDVARMSDNDLSDELYDD